MNEEKAILSGISADPDDDTTRLVYADCLEEHDDPERAEFIRLQCEIAALHRNHPWYYDHPRLRHLTRREDELLELHRKEWLGNLADLWPGPSEDYSDQWVFRRGFPDFILARDLGEFRRAAPALFKVAPVSLRGVRFTHLDDWSPVARWRSLSRLSELRLEPDMASPAGLERLAQSSHTGSLSVLHLQEYDLSTRTASALASSPLFARLKEFCIQMGLCDGLVELGAAGGLARLERLLLRADHVEVSGARALAESPCFCNLRCLDLSGNKIGTGGAEALAGSPHLRRLTSLGLHGNRIRSDGAEALAGSPNLTGVAHLDLSCNDVSTRGVEALVASTQLPSLRVLNLSGNEDIGVAGARALLNSPLPDRLEMLDLRNCRMSSGKAAEVMAALQDQMGERLVYGGTGRSRRSLSDSGLCRIPPRGSLSERTTAAFGEEPSQAIVLAQEGRPQLEDRLRSLRASPVLLLTLDPRVELPHQRFHQATGRR